MALLKTQYEYDVVLAINQLIPDFYCIIITNEKGNVYSYLSSDDCANSQKLSDIIEIAKLFTNRLRSGEFNEALGKFQLATLAFEKHYLIGRFIPNNKILIVAISKDHAGLESKINKVINIIKMPYFDNEKKIMEIKEKLKPIPPMPIDIQKETGKLVSKRYILVAEPYS